jgi:glycosyltransferase involved in cell wall biosynthesis
LPFVIDHHNVESHMLLRRAENETHPFKKAYFFQEGIRLRHYERCYCSRASLNITCSDIDAQRLREIGPGIRTEVIPNGVDLDYFAPNRPRPGNRSPKLLFLGTLDWYPNRAAVEFIADRLWPLLKQRLPDIRIDVIGANPPDKVVALGNHDPAFIVHGFVNDIRVFMNNADIFLCPISDGGGTKLKVLDALSMALPVVAHPLACEGIDVTDGKHVMLAETTQDYIEAIVTLLKNPALAESLGSAGRRLIEAQYDFVRIGEKLAAHYIEVAVSSKKARQCVESQA